MGDVESSHPWRNPADFQTGETKQMLIVLCAELPRLAVQHYGAIKLISLLFLR